VLQEHLRCSGLDWLKGQHDLTSPTPAPRLFVDPAKYNILCLDSLEDLVTIPRLDLPQSCRINDTGVHVAVFENGPSDTTDLVDAEVPMHV